ncbi:type III secretion protein SctO [Trinickia sp. LjRoot230]|uniref:type III secretion protein SctO n=1 Tax=Trinickia sp. LjRoot230 TaxID=3342288 RepID=UPI003ECE6DDA
MDPASIARRIAALERTVSRRRRLDETLTAELAARREEQAQLQRECDAKQEEVQRERDLLQTYYDRIANMMSGGSVVSVTEMTACMRYTDVVAERLRAREGELQSIEAAVQDKAQQVALAARAIANNRGRIDLCKDRIKDLERDQLMQASDAADEEAEEAALARARLASATRH